MRVVLQSKQFSPIAGNFSCDTLGAVQAKKVLRAGPDETLLGMVTGRGWKEHFGLTPPVNAREKQPLKKPFSVPSKVRIPYGN